MPVQKFTLLTLPNLLRALKWLAYLAVGLCGISAVFLMLLLLINLPMFDEELHPDLVVPPLNDPFQILPDNAYAGLMGLRASPDREFIAAGQALMRRYLANRAAGNDRLTDVDYDELLGPEPLNLGLLRCGTPPAECTLEQLGGMLQAGDYERGPVEVVIQRYNALLVLPTLQFMYAPTYASPAPNYLTARNAQNYALAASYNTGSSTAFLNQVAADLKFWRLALANGPWVLDKMVAIASLWTDMQMLSEYMTTHDLSAEDRMLIAGFLAPLSADELDISETFLAEGRSLYNTLAYLHEHPEDRPEFFGNRLQLQLTLTNATSNQNYTHVLQPLMAMSKLSAEDYARAISTPEVTAEEQQQRNLGLSPRNLYNLGGKLMLADVNYPGGYTYIGRVHDINTMMMAVQTQFELKGMPREQMLGALRTKMETLRANSAATFNYDAATGKLSFQCYDPPSRLAERCGVQL